MPTKPAKGKTKPADFRLAIQYADGINPKELCLSAARTRRLMKAALPAACTGINATLRYVNEAESKRLNSRFRGKKKPTNILTFNYSPLPEVHADLVICLSLAIREAFDQQKPADHHLAHLIVHGTLHACGLDHEQDLQAQAMERLEAGILKRFRIPDPYAMPLKKPSVAR